MSDGVSVPRRQLGRLLREAREAAGISIEGASRSLQWSRAKMYRVESGDAPIRTHDVAVMCALFGVAPELQDVLATLSKEAGKGGWWHAYGETIPPWFELYVGMEANALRLRRYDLGLVPGLFQTPEYAEQVLRRVPGNTEEKVAGQVALRMERQQILTRRRPVAPKVDALVDEGVLRRPLQDREVWLAQLIRLRELATWRNISIRVLPFHAGPHPGTQTGSFLILDFLPMGLRTPEPTTIYTDGLTGALYLDKPSDVESYVSCWNDLAALAMNPTESSDLISTLIKECEGWT